MKTAKRKFYQTLLALGFIILQCTMSVHAGGLEQSEQTVSAALQHEHAQDECWNRIWVPCGGWWGSYFETYVGATVYYCTNGNSSETRNGVVLSSIHPGWEYKEHTGLHDGEYVNRCICDQSVAGIFTLTKETSELTASVTSQGAGVSEASIFWTCPDQSVTEGERVTISQNGIYRATLNWRDAKTGDDHTSTLDYVEISNPVTLIFQSGGKELDRIEVSYGDPLPEIGIPEKKGYDFQGYFVGLTSEGENEGESGEENKDAAMWYDKEGSPDKSITVTLSALEETLSAKWEARSYHVYYGEDKDGDGTGDCELYVTYGEAYGPIEINGEEKGGYVFDGYYLGKEQVFDSDGSATGVWRWDGEGDMILEAVYHKKPDASSGRGTHGDGEKEGQDTAPALPGRVSDDSISGNSISENSISENTISGNGISGNGSAGGQTESGSSVPGQGRTGGNTDSGHGGSDTGHGEGEMRPFHDRISSSDGSGSFGAAADGSAVMQETVSQRISENMAAGRTAEAGMLRSSSAVVRALEVTGITAGILGLAYLAVWLVITKASLAEIHSVRADGGRRHLGAALILHGENAFHIHIRDRMLEKGETGKYQIVFRKRFAVKHANRDMIIHCRGKEISEMVRENIIFFTE